MAEITVDLKKLLSKNNILQLSAILQVNPADDETKKQLKEFRKNCIAINKHRDTNIKATVIYKMMRHGKQIDDLLVFMEGTTVPKYWLAKGDLCLLFLFCALGIPLAGKNIFKLTTSYFELCSCYNSLLKNEHPETDNHERDYYELYWCMILFV